MITLSEYAFSKLSWFRVNCTDDNVQGIVTKNPQFLEVSLMGISESEENIGHIVDFVCVPQECSSGLTEPDDDGMNAYIETMLLDKEISIIRCARFWAHTHPGASPVPSSTDNETFVKWFGHSDFGVMYILAKDDDSCKVKYPSKYFGPQVSNMAVFVELDKIDDRGNKILLSTKTMFAINKIGNSDGYTDVSALILNDYSDFEADWTQELRANVKKKQYYVTYPHYSTNTHKQAPANQTLIQNSSSGTGKVTEATNPPKIRIHNVIDLLINAGKGSINEFSKEEKEKILKFYDISMGEFQGKYNELLKCEKTFDHFELMAYEKDFVDDHGQSKFEQISKSKMLDYCKTFSIRPSHLKSTIDTYIEKAHALDFGVC